MSRSEPSDSCSSVPRSFALMLPAVAIAYDIGSGIDLVGAGTPAASAAMRTTSALLIIFSEIRYRSPTRPRSAARIIARAASSTPTASSSMPLHHERQLAERRARDDRAVRGAAPVTASVGRRHAHRDGGQAVLLRVLQHHVLGLHPGPDVRRQPAVDDDVVLGGAVAATAADGDVAAGEDELAQVGILGDFEHVAGAARHSCGTAARDRAASRGCRRRSSTRRRHRASPRAACRCPRCRRRSA